ncbi:hypothetical protein [Desulfopila sp. IMCC35008]|uniref:hypothetical protein n=1 Tax=Desulfopila sp. IMCC35008 TaxID=2653858 RepID=UPI0013D2C2F6|nr:hypothetical protein [Desulfopila sp. IMCC35008]
MQSKYIKIFIYSLIAGWLVVSFAALAAMYKLWWERERVDYLSKSVTEQREIIWQKAGFYKPLLATTEKLTQIWPENIDYKRKEDRVKFSYAAYLLLPRMPYGEKDYIVYGDGGYFPLAGEITDTTNPSKLSTIWGPITAVILLLGITLILKNTNHGSNFSFPEVAGCSLLFLVIWPIISKGLTGSASYGFIINTIVGVISWLLLFTIWRKKRSSNITIHMIDHPNNFEKFLGWTFMIIICLSVIWVMLMSVVVVPDDWDAWAIWGSKAKVLALVQGPLQDVTAFDQADYPLLWPTIWAYSGWLSGGWEEMWSRGWGGIFLILCCWEIAVIIYRWKHNILLALFGAALFSSMPMVPLVASWSYAEAPFWLFIITCVGCLLMRKDNDKMLITVIAALLASGAAYTKNEGVLFSCLASIWILFLPGRRPLAHFSIFLVVFFVTYAPWFWWVKIYLGLGSHATSGLHFDIGNIQRALGRAPIVAEIIARMWIDIKQWNIVLAITTLAIIPMSFHKEFRIMLFLPVLLLVGYFVITVFHDADVYWQTGGSWNRLTIHVMPVIVVILIGLLDKYVALGKEKIDMI